MITVLQSLPVASSDAAAAPGNTAQDGAENGFSQMFAAARAASADKPAADARGGNAAPSRGSTLPPDAAEAALAPPPVGTAGAAAEPPTAAWQSFTLSLQALAEPGLEGAGQASAATSDLVAAGAGDAALPGDATPSPANPALPLPVATAEAALRGDLPGALEGSVRANVTTGAATPLGSSVPAAPEAAADLLPGAGTREANSRAERVVAPAATATAAEESGMLAAAERARGEEAAVLQGLRQRAVEGAVDAPRLASASGNVDAAALNTPVTAAAQGAAAQADAQAPAAPRTPAQLAMTHTPQDPEFTGELANRLQVFARNGGHEATLQLHPADLGRLQVSITTEGDQARVLFVADSAAARDAIEQSLPRLREMLAQSGLQLAHSDVSSQSQGSGDSQRDAVGGSRQAAADDSGDGFLSGAAESASQPAAAGARLVDYYI
ncbi:MAG: hypothetical protein CME43_13610 [Haliea sp.]|uniref:flagellar hook-length control protein FliK n=1 Tax=Haliea sp. TaxID=1932666 RepID=UPI000C594886|nr:flagellar hook-length control protein FliK [Haliea sp.]MBM70499.1 hypothetical protein [Haliea sp.]|tara:strand:+ start:50253 stop:51572 length:1320 start_codon:yes stop_codon:yes gene_type:complete